MTKKFEPGATRNYDAVIKTHELLNFEPKELSIQTDSLSNLNYTGVVFTPRNKEKFTTLCPYNSPSVNNRDFFDQFELLLESHGNIQNYHLIGDFNIELLDCSPVANRYFSLFGTHACGQAIEKSTRVIKTDITDLFAILR